MNKEEKKLADIGQFRLSDQLTRHNTNTPNPSKMEINQENFVAKGKKDMEKNSTMTNTNWRILVNLG